MNPIQDFCRDRLRMVSNSGAIFPVQLGVVMDKTITLFDTSVPLLPGDSIWHYLPNGHHVEYLVTHSGLAPAQGALPASYHARVVPANPQRLPQLVHHPDVLIDGDEELGGKPIERGRHTLAQLAMFRDLRRATRSLPKVQRARATALVAAMESANPQRARISTYQEFIGFAVDHLPVYQPTLVALTEWLSD